MTEKILLVDDEPNVLDAYRRTLRKRFDFDTATSGPEGIGKLLTGGPFAVVVADMNMPEMNGIEFLRRVKEWDDDVIRIMLTGSTDFQLAMRAVNEGSIFRFLSKPCFPDDLSAALESALQQYRLINAERELLEKTLAGSIQMLTDILSLVNPTAFGRAARVKRLVRRLCEVLEVEKIWQVEIAAMLSQIGCIALPEETIEKVYHGKPLSGDELEMLKSHPQVARDLVSQIPRLEAVAEIIENQERRFDSVGDSRIGNGGFAIPLGARILKVALDFDKLCESKVDRREALAEMRRRGSAWYDPVVLEALVVVQNATPAVVERQVPLGELQPGMVLGQDLITDVGVVLMRKGQEVTPSIVMRLKAYSDRHAVGATVRAFVHDGAVQTPVPSGRELART